MKKLGLTIMLMAAVTLVLVACDAAIPGADIVSEVEEPSTDEGADVEEAPEEAEQTTEQEALAPADSVAEESVEEGGRIVTAWIGPELADCVGVGPQECMQVKTNPDDDYSLFYDQIEGFEFEEGFEYQLQVLVEPVQNPPQDASALKFTLVEVVSKTPVEGAAAQEAVGEVSVAMEEELTLEGPTWLLETYVNLEDQPTERLPETRVTITFADGVVSGTGGCNNYSGSYEVDGSNLTIGQPVSTMMACVPDEILIQETAYFANLGNVASYEIIDGRLHLRDADGQSILIYSQDIEYSLTGTVWTVTGYNNGRGGVTSVVIGTEMTAVFAKVGIVGGSSGCNNYRATYEADNGNITIGPAALTRKMCAEPEGIMEQESQYLAALEMAATYEIDGARMDMYDESGARVATFEGTETVEEALEEKVDMPVIASGDGAEAAAEVPAESTDVESETAAAEALQLAGTRWQWVKMVTPLEIVEPDDPSQYLVEFMDDGVIGILADCNSGSGSYETSGSSISINITNTTLALCPEGSLSDQFIRNLNSAAIYFDQNGNLFIDLMADAGTMEFAPN